MMTQERFPKTKILVKNVQDWKANTMAISSVLYCESFDKHEPCTTPRVLCLFFIPCAQSNFSWTTLQTYSVCDVFDATLLSLRQAINYDTVRACFLFLSNLRVCILLPNPFAVTFTSRTPSHQSLFSCWYHCSWDASMFSVSIWIP